MSGLDGLIIGLALAIVFGCSFAFARFVHLRASERTAALLLAEQYARRGTWSATTGVAVSSIGAGQLVSVNDTGEFVPAKAEQGTLGVVGFVTIPIDPEHDALADREVEVRVAGTVKSRSLRPSGGGQQQLPARVGRLEE